MYELDFVRRRKRRRIAAIIAAAGSVGVGSLSIIAFLGRFVGTFTVSVNNGEVDLSLSEKISFAEPQSLLRISSLSKYDEIAYESLPDVGTLDNEDFPYTLGAVFDGQEMVSMKYFKYTFYVKNVGQASARYRISFKITENKPADDGTGRTLDDTLRVMIFDNEASGSLHDKKIYAKEAAEFNYLADGTKTRREFIGRTPYNRTEDETNKLVDGTFLSESLVTEYEVPDFKANDIRRYTFVSWLEGEDRQSEKDKEPPRGATIKLGVEINAYAN